MINDISKPKRWQKSGVNLYTYLPTGDYYAKAKIGGKLKEKCLQTDKITVARLRLAEFLREERRKAEREKNLTRGNMTMAGAIERFKEDLEANPRLKPRSKEYRLERLGALLRTWPDFEKFDMSRITKQDCDEWQKRFGAKASPTAFNNTVGTLAMLLDIGIEHGARYENPAKLIRKHRPRAKLPDLPSKQQFIEMLRQVETVKVGRVRMCADLIRFLAFGGFRKGEAARIVWQDCDFERGIIHVKGDPTTGTKNWEVRQVPMIKEMRSLLDRMRAARPDIKPTDRVTEVAECQGVLTRACKAAGISRLTHHDLRHLFATLVIECGVDIPSMSRWLGHKDGGALAMKVYGHLRHEHSLLMAQRVSFGTDAIHIPTPQPSGGMTVEKVVNVAGGNENAPELLVFPQLASIN